MIETLQSPRRLYLCLAYAFVAGAACALTNCLAGCLAVESALVVTLTNGFSVHVRATNMTWLLALLIPIIAFGYTRFRLASVEPDVLAHYDGRSVILLGEVSSPQVDKHTNTTTYGLTVNRLVFPDDRAVHSKIKLSVTPDIDSKAEPQYQPQPHPHPQSKFQSQFQNQSLPQSCPLTIRAVLRKSKDYQHKVIAFCKPNDAATTSTTTRQDITQAFLDHITSTTDEWIDQARKTIVSTHLSTLENAAGSLLSSMVLGDKAIKMPESITENFRVIGLSHILAASGFNLTLVISMCFMGTASLLPNERHRSLVAFLMMTLFVLLAGFSSSIIRAAMMSTVVLGAKLFSRRCGITAIIGTALLLTTIIDPHALLDLGLQLSYAATLGITLAAQPFTDLIQITPSRIGKFISELVGTCLIAQMFVLPIQAFAFCNANILFLLANVLVLPLVGPITTVGFVSSLFALIAGAIPASQAVIHPVCQFLDGAVRLPLLFILFITHHLSEVEWAKLNVGKPELFQVTGAYAFFGMFAIAMKRHWHRITVLGLASAGLCTLLSRPQSAELRIGVFKTGTVLINADNDAIIASIPERPRASAINTAPSTSTQDNAMKKYLAAHAIRESLVVPVLPRSSITSRCQPSKNNGAEDYDAPLQAPSAPAESIANHDITLNAVSNDFFSYNDHSHHIGILYFASPWGLHSATISFADWLGRLSHTETRYLILRLDSGNTKFSSQKPERIFFDTAHTMASCGLEKAIIIFDKQQLPLFKPLLSMTRADSTSTAGKNLIIDTTKQFSVITLTRAQMAVQEKHCND